MKNIVIRLALCLLSLTAIAWIALVLFLVRFDFRDFAVRTAGQALHRSVQVESLKIGWDGSLRLDIRGVRVPGPAWGSEPDMVKIGRLQAAIDIAPLLHGVVQYRHLTLDGIDILLERDKNHVGNWHFEGMKAVVTPARGLALVPANRTQFPTLIDAVIHDGRLRLRTTGGSVQTIDVHDLRINADSAESPAQFSLDGAYNDVPAKLTMRSQSFAIMRDASVPFGVELSIATKKDRLGFKGTLMEPLDFDGVRGQLTLAAPVVSDLLEIGGLDTKVPFGFDIKGGLTKKGDHWRLAKSGGQIAGNGFTGSLLLDEGARGRPDAIGLDLAFGTLDLKDVMKGMPKKGPDHSSGSIALTPDKNPGTTLDARIAAKTFTTGTIRLNDTVLHLKILPGRTVLDYLRFVVAGGRAVLSGRIDAGDRLTLVQADATLKNADIVQALGLLGIRQDVIAGRFNAAATLDGEGATVDKLWRNSDGALAVSLNHGAIAQNVLEQASVDLRSLVRYNNETTPVICMAGVMMLHNGTGVIRPLRLHTDLTNINAAGAVDLLHKQADLSFRGESGSGGFLALNVPIHISGPFSDIRIGPTLHPDNFERTPPPVARRMLDMVASDSNQCTR